MMPPRPRLDPRADRARHTVPGGPRARLDRASAFEAAAPGPPPALGPPPAPGHPSGPGAERRISIDAPAAFIMVVPDAEGGRLSLHDRQVIGAARVLADAAAWAVLALSPPGQDDLAAALGRAGADRRGLLPGLASARPEQRAASVVGAIRAIGPMHVLFPESPDGADLARRVAVLTGDDFMADVEALSQHACVRAAQARQIEQSRPLPRLISLQADSSLPYAGIPRAIRDHDWAPAPVPPASEDGPVLQRGDPAAIPLTEAGFVIAAGQGVTDFDRFRALAAALGATPGASRMVCDLGLLPRACQVGASGSVLEAECYLALGISGAPQHLQGIGRVAHIVAVNTDLHAAMVERAGLAIIADAQAVSAALLEALVVRT